MEWVDEAAAAAFVAGDDHVTFAEGMGTTPSASCPRPPPGPRRAGRGVRHLAHPGPRRAAPSVPREPREISPRSQSRVAPVTLQDLIDLLNLREASGPMAARLAAQSPPAELERLSEEMEFGYGLAADSSSVLSASHLFHCTTARLSGNARLHRITESLFGDLEGDPPALLGASPGAR